MQNELYTREYPESYSNNHISIRLNSKSENLRINPIIWIKYKIKFDASIRSFYNGSVPNGTFRQCPTTNTYLATRQGWCMSRAMDNVSVNVNNKNTIQFTPRFYIDPLSRLYISDKVAENSTSGGRFDKGLNGNTTTHDFIHPGTLNAVDYTAYIPPLGSSNIAEILGDAFQNACVERTIISENSSYVNYGLEQRKQKVYENLIRNDTSLVYTTAQIDMFPAHDTSTLEIWEPLPIEPFYMLTKFQKPYDLMFIKKLNVRINFNNSMFKYIFDNNSAVAPTISFDEPEIWVKYMDVVGIEMPLTLPVHMCNVKHFTLDRTSDIVLLSGTNTFVYDINATSRKLYFYMRKTQQDNGDPTEHFLGIDEIKIRTPTVNHEISSRQLYNMWTRESVGKDLSYDEWRTNKSVVVLDAVKLQLSRRITFEVKWRNYWKIPTFMSRVAVAVDDANVDYSACLIYSHDVEFNY